MTSAAARREDIQLRLQQLQERRAREAAAFDAIAAEHPELSAEEVTLRAQQQAANEEPQELVIAGSTVHVGDRVRVKDDAALLRSADRGFFAPDVLKPVYLGEWGTVTRVIESFQGKPALELRFADGVTKIFFANCIDGAAADAAAASPRRNAAEVPVFVPPAKATPAPPLKAEAVPGWDALAMPHRRSAPTAQPPRTKTPPPPPSVAALRRKETAATPASAATVRAATHAPSVAAPLPALPAGAGNSLGATVWPAAMAEPPEDAMDLRPTPDSAEHSFIAPAPSMAIAAVMQASAEPSAVPEPTPALPAAAAPRRASLSSTAAVGARVCWVSGLVEAQGEVSEPMRVVLQPQCATMFAIFAVVSRKLRWDAQRCTASRLYTEDGAELKVASAVQDGMRLVATTGCSYKPDDHPEPMAALSLRRRSSVTSPRNSTASTPMKSSTAALAKPATTSTIPSFKPPPAAAPSSRPPASAAPPIKAPQAAAPRRRLSTAVSPKHPPPAVTVGAPTKLRHIRVYENGVYDDNVYRTVTLRPTYKTLTSLKTTITRELQWRDGKRADILFDASGAEIADLDAIVDGDVVVASAGDRFVIPYPTTVIHREAMKLSERMDPPPRS